ncbi:uncharacterized protein N7479_007949 [Penicillium vulpinum]|uniref:Terrelysin n=1 Tax=Penicillium vulpinum TaxID=29845 RepID=A0A1V6RMB1_9EURO|nr:uncharacterized protein N7479_007949 [Penicillium vulpinum]KAJ5960799.1 hypothetical protein N7479_007949 [Penicillium vulpinum]OQE02698.1 hypothetical protein PENVUL_c039G04402 [Penicillium vulpinum]
MDTIDKYNTKWVQFHIRDHIKDGQILVQNTVIEGGEFADPNDRRKSLTEDEIDEIKISGDGIGEFGARSRRGSEGRLDLFHDDEKICELHWENRGGEHENLVEVLDKNNRYKINHCGWSSEPGPLGHVFIDVEEKKE